MSTLFNYLAGPPPHSPHRFKASASEGLTHYFIAMRSDTTTVNLDEKISAEQEETTTCHLHCKSGILVSTRKKAHSPDNRTDKALFCNTIASRFTTGNAACITWHCNLAGVRKRAAACIKNRIAI